MKVNWNTLIITMGFSVIGYFGKGAVEDLRATHDAVLVMKQELRTMTPLSAFDVQMSEVRARLSSIEVEIQKLKEKRQ